MKAFRRQFVSRLKSQLESHSDLIQMVVGPRQVGKTTGVLQLLESYATDRYHFVSADGDVQRPTSWIAAQWAQAQSGNHCDLVVIDEIQKVANWSEAIKSFWDEQKRSKKKSWLRLIVLGSSSLELQRGLSESLAGRALQHIVPHWGFLESKEAFHLSLEDYLTYGGYPGSYGFRDSKVEWLNFVRHSIVDAVLGKDILSLARVRSPALFRQCFDLACSYGGQEISYTKLLGQLQERGNTELIKHYLELFEGAFLLKQLFKFSNKKVLSRSSSPKILPLCPALFSMTKDADLERVDRGRAFEIMVGAELEKLPGSLFYWREGDSEVDFVYQFGRRLVAIEVKLSPVKSSGRGLGDFRARFPKSEIRVVNPDTFESVLADLARS